MSPTSYQTAPPRDIYFVLSAALADCSSIIPHSGMDVNPFLKKFSGSLPGLLRFPSGPAHFLFLRHTATPPATAAAMTTTGHAPARKTASCCTPCAKFCQPLANASAMREIKLSLGGE